MTSSGAVGATAVDAGGRVVASEELAVAVEVGRVVVTLNGGKVTDEAVSSPPPQPVASAATTSTLAVANVRLTRMHNMATTASAA